jgi:hypothetical protein
MKRVLQLVYWAAQPPTNHAVFRRLGYRDIIDDVTKLFRGGHKDEATGAIPDELLDDAAIIGDIDHVRNQICRRQDSGVTMLVVNVDNDEQIMQNASLLESRSTPRTGSSHDF